MKTILFSLVVVLGLAACTDDTDPRIASVLEAALAMPESQGPGR